MPLLSDEAVKMLKRINKGKPAVLIEKQDRLTLQTLQIDGYVKLIEAPDKYKITPKGVNQLADQT